MDAMQDTFVQVIRYQERLDGHAPSSLLYRMATNVCLNKLRSQKRRPEVPDGDLIEKIAHLPDAERLTGARKLLARLFETQQESTRTIAVLHLLDGLTLQEVADEVGMSVSGVRKRLRGLRAKLHELDAMQPSVEAM